MFRVEWNFKHDNLDLKAFYINNTIFKILFYFCIILKKYGWNKLLLKPLVLSGSILNSRMKKETTLLYKGVIEEF